MGEFVRFQRWETANLALVPEVIRASRNVHTERDYITEIIQMTNFEKQALGEIKGFFFRRNLIFVRSVSRPTPGGKKCLRALTPRGREQKL